MEETRKRGQMGQGSEGQFLPTHFLDAGMDNIDDHPESQWPMAGLLYIATEITLI